MKKILAVSFTVILLAGCYKSDLESAKTENNQLKSQINQLEAEVIKLKQTAQYHFQQGQDKLSAKKYSEAIISFKTVLDKYPNDPLVTSSKKALVIAEQQ
jgi:outer membrane protein assembly factor BamD (BamD/ComL family)